jgi:uncharacterized protein DUF2513
MKRDMDLIRSILLEIEKIPFDGGWHEVSVEGHSENDILYHVMLLQEAGMIVAVNLSSHDGTSWLPIRLTWEGHEFLDSARTETIWAKAKARVSSATGSLALAGLKIALGELTKQAIMTHVPL